MYDKANQAIELSLKRSGKEDQKKGVYEGIFQPTQFAGKIYQVQQHYKLKQLMHQNG